MDACIASATRLVELLPDCSGAEDACLNLQNSRFVLMREGDQLPVAQTDSIGHFFTYYGTSRDYFVTKCLGALCNSFQLTGDVSVRWRTGDERHEVRVLDLHIDPARMEGKEKMVYEFPAEGVSVPVTKLKTSLSACLDFHHLGAAEISASKLMFGVHAVLSTLGSVAKCDLIERMSSLLEQAEKVAHGMKEGKRQFAELLSDQRAEERVPEKKRKGGNKRAQTK